MGYNPQESLENTINTIGTLCHQEFEVPKMEGFLDLMFGYFGDGFSLTYAASIQLI